MEADLTPLATRTEPARRRLLAAAVLVVAVGSTLPAAASAAEPAPTGGAHVQGTSTVEAQREVDTARRLVDESVDVVAAGNRARAYKLARDAYIDHFELAEIPLRLRDPNLVLDAEFSFAELRNGIQGGAGLDDVKADARDVRRMLDDVDHVLSRPGVAAPLLAAGLSFSIIFREGLEAVLMIAVLLGALEAGRAAGYRRPLLWGVGGALLATALTWLLAELVIDIAPLGQELIAGIAGLLAVTVLFAVSFWLVSRMEQRRWMEFMRSRVSAAIATGSALAFAGLGFTAVYREGFETVLFYQTLLLFAHGLGLWIALGLTAGTAALGGVAWAILRLGRRLPIRTFLAASAAVVLLLSIAFLGNAVAALQDADMLSVTPVASHALRLPVFLIDITGIHATKEGLAAQASLALVYLVGIAYLLMWLPARRRRSAQQAEAQPRAGG